MLLGVLMWGRAGVYTSQMPGFFILGAAGIATLFLGNHLSKDKDPNRAVAWKPTDALQSALEPSTAPVDADNPGEMMNCPNCGTLTRVGAGFCGNCGAKLATTAGAGSPNLTSSPSPTVPPLAPPPPPPPPPSATESGATMQQKMPAEPEPALESEAPHEPEAPAVPDDSIGQDNAGMITLPPGLVAASPSGPKIETPAPSMAEAVFITSPGVPVAVPQEEDVDATRVSMRRRGGSPWRLVLPDGQHYIVDGVVLIGRDAAPRAKWPDAKLLSVQDTTKSVSKTHAVIEADSDGLWVTDLKSTNGVVVTGGDGQELDGDDGQRLPVKSGSDIYLGDYVIQVEKD